MRRLVVCAVALLVVTTFAPSASAVGGRDVKGTVAGAGGFEFVAGCGVITEVGSGTFRATALGHGTYTFTVCIEIAPTITFNGTIAMTTTGGATLTGTIGGSFTGGPGPAFDVVVTGGTKQFANAAGTLTVGPLIESDFTNCDPRVGICLNWRDVGPITGAITTSVR
jgi:hypothetical protein